MSSDTPFFEYLIIGTHASSWLLIIAMKITKVPLNSLLKIDPAIVILLLPFIYVLGMLFDDLSFRPLDSTRKRIQYEVFKSEAPKDELLAISSESLYAAYEMRVRRVRIVGASIFNWPLLCFAVLLHVGNWMYQLSLVILGISLTAISVSVWKRLYRRAYKFRKNASEVIRDNFSSFKTSKKFNGGSKA